MLKLDQDSCGSRLVLGSSSGELFGLIGEQEQVGVWSIRTGKRKRTFAVPFSDVHAYATDGLTFVYVNHEENQIQLYDTKKGKRIQTFSLPTEPFVYTVAIHPLWKTIILGAGDQVIELDAKGQPGKNYFTTYREEGSHHLTPEMGFSLDEFFYVDYTNQCLDIWSLKQGKIHQHKHKLDIKYMDQSSNFYLKVEPVVYFDQHIYLIDSKRSELLIIDLHQKMKKKISLPTNNFRFYSLIPTKEVICVSGSNDRALIFTNPMYSSV
jgi:WD40 repeat protein